MSTDTESFLFDPHGPVHTGPGDQINRIVNLALSAQRPGRRPRTAAAPEDLAWLAPRFDEPGNFGRARDRLADNGNVLLTGAPGSGRRTAALMLLHWLPSAHVPIQELDDSDPSGSSDRPVLDPDTVDAGQRLLLDLSLSAEPNYRRVLAELPSFRTVVHERGAHLVVVLAGSRKHYPGSEFRSSIVEITRPNGRQVFQSYLRSDGIRFTPEQLDVDELAAQLPEPMQHIANLAELVHLARDAEPRQTFPHWLREALAALLERRDQVRQRMMRLRSSQQRALLLATAMFSGAQADAVFDAAARLCTTLRQPEDDRPRLEREGLTERLAEIDAGTDDAGRVSFTLLAYDRAVQAHFWTDFPDLRASFRDWVATAIDQRMLTSEDRDAVVIRFAEQALRTDRPDDLRLLAERWARRTDSRWQSSSLPQAARVLVDGLSHERHGIFFRRLLYHWSRDPSLTHDLALVVVRVCADVLAVTHPDQAVVRLHHIFRRQSGMAGAVALDALLDLVDRDRRLYRLLLDRVTEALRTQQDAVADLAMFLELVAPARLLDSTRWTRPLIENLTVRNRLVTGWRAVLNGLPLPRCAGYVRSWLTACEDSPDQRALLLDVLVTASDSRPDVLSRLYVIARDWGHAPGERRVERSQIATHVNHKIDSAQGIDFTDLNLGYRTEEASS
ncbi:MAG: hypothetical protein ACRDTC_04415 [Pseudonocardiaceae bacterium]